MIGVNTKFGSYLLDGFDGGALRDFKISWKHSLVGVRAVLEYSRMLCLKHFQNARKYCEKNSHTMCNCMKIAAKLSLRGH